MEGFLIIKQLLLLKLVFQKKNKRLHAFNIKVTCAQEMRQR